MLRSLQIYFIIGAVFLVLGGGFFFRDQYMRNKVDNLELRLDRSESRGDSLQESLSNYLENREVTEKALSDLATSLTTTRSAIRADLEVFRNHDLQKLAEAKPGLIEVRANEATKEIFDTLEKESNISARILPNGIILLDASDGERND